MTKLTSQRLQLQRYPILVANEAYGSGTFIADAASDLGYDVSLVETGAHAISRLRLAYRQHIPHLAFIPTDLLFDLVVSERTRMRFRTNQDYKRFETEVDPYPSIVTRYAMMREPIYLEASRSWANRMRQEIYKLSAFHACVLLTKGENYTPFEEIREELPAGLPVPVLNMNRLGIDDTNGLSIDDTIIDELIADEMFRLNVYHNGAMQMHQYTAKPVAA